MLSIHHHYLIGDKMTRSSYFKFMLIKKIGKQEIHTVSIVHITL